MSPASYAPAPAALAALQSREHHGALVVIDVQRSFGDPSFLEAWGLDDPSLTAIASAVARVGAVVAEARALDIPVVWVRLESSPTEPWRGSNWLSGRDPDVPPGDDYPCVHGTPGAQWYRVAPQEGESVITKQRYSGFHGTDLEDVLRSRGITWVTLVGLTTECCVASTAFDAIQRDFPAVVVEDATAANDAATHMAALRQLAANAAAVVTASQIIDLWRARVAEWETAS